MREAYILIYNGFMEENETDSPALYIRKTVLGLRQVEMAELLGVSQATCSRYEAAGLYPSEAQIIIRDYVRRKRLRWNDSWFFEAPKRATA